MRAQQGAPEVAAKPSRRQMAQEIVEAIEQNSEMVGYLVSRWHDESEYEDLQSYEPLLQECLPTWVKVESMTAKPFGCQLVANGERFLLSLHVSGRVRVQMDIC